MAKVGEFQGKNISFSAGCVVEINPEGVEGVEALRTWRAGTNN